MFLNNNIIEGLYTNIPIMGKITQNILTLDTPMCFSQGGFLKSTDSQQILDISQQPITIAIGSTMKINSYQLSGNPYPNIDSSNSMPMIISTENPCPKQDISVKGSINGTTFSLSSAPIYTIYPGYLLFSESGYPLKDKDTNQDIIINSGDSLTYILSGEPKNTTTLEKNYIIREP